MEEEMPSAEVHCPFCKRTPLEIVAKETAVSFSDHRRDVILICCADCGAVLGTFLKD